MIKKLAFPNGAAALFRVVRGVTIRFLIVILALTAYGATRDSQAMCFRATSPLGWAAIVLDESGWVVDLRDFVKRLPWHVESSTYECDSVIDTLEDCSVAEIRADGDWVWRFAGIGVYSHSERTVHCYTVTFRHRVVCVFCLILFAAFGIRRDANVVAHK